MKVLIISAHPEADSFNSFLASIAARICEKQGSLVQTVNLYSENFAPCEGQNFTLTGRTLRGLIPCWNSAITGKSIICLMMLSGI